jgi:hypothetical protein
MQRETKLNPPPAEWSPPLDRGRERATAGEAWLEVARRVAADLWDVPPAALLLDTRFRRIWASTTWTWPSCCRKWKMP